MENYTLGLALFDYLPVIAAGFGLYFICSYCAGLGNYRGRWVIAIPAIALIGGVLKASWKLIYAINGVDNRWMSDQLFFFLAPAYVLMAVLVISALRSNARQHDLPSGWWRSGLIIVVIVIGVALYLKSNVPGRAWSILLLATLSLANLLFLLSLVSHAWGRRNRVAVSCFMLNLALSFGLVGLARMEQTAGLQWIEEFLNLANNSLLAVGAWSLIRGAVSDN